MRLDHEKLEVLTLPNASCLIMLLYTILSILFTYPVAFSTNKIPGGGDVFWFLWDFWWFKKAVLNLSNPYYTMDLFYPTGVSLAFSDVSPFNAIISIPLQHFFGLIAAYNVIWILTFVLSGFGTYLLVNYLINNKSAAFISGLIFMLCPYHFAHALGHMNLTATEWIPFYVLFLIKMTRENKRSNSLYAAFFLVLAAMTSNYYLLYMFIFTLLYIIYYWLVDESLINKGFIKRLSAMSLIFVVCFSPFLYIISKDMLLSRSNYMYAEGFVEYSADLLAFFTPTIFHPCFKDIISPINSHFTGNGAEFTVFAGYTVLFLSILAILKIRTKEIKFWTLSATTFFVLSLGPILHIKGAIIVAPFEKSNFVIPLPYIILMHIPILSMARVPSRWDVLVMLSLAILSGYGLNYIFKSSAKSWWKGVIFIVVSCMILFEFLAVPFPMSSSEVPAIYKKMAAETDDYAVLELPEWRAADYMYFQTVHGKKLVNGYVSRTPDYALEFASRISDLMKPSDTATFSFSPQANIWTKDGIMEQSKPRELMSVFYNYNIRYLIIHKRYLSVEQFSYVSNLIHDAFGIQPEVYDSDGLWVYHIPASQNSSSFISLGSSFQDIENRFSTPIRWTQANGTLLIYSSENHTANLGLEAISFYRNRTLEVYTGDKLTARLDVPTVYINVTVPVHLAKGSNIMRFYSPEGCEKPSTKPELKNNDQRCLSVTILNMTLKYV